MPEYADAKGCYKIKQIIEPRGFECLMVLNDTQK